jgi:hypothetical protein
VNKTEVYLSTTQNDNLHSCKFNDLESSETKKEVYIRDNIQSRNANLYLTPKKNDLLEEDSMVVYKTNSNQANLARISMKYCRRCVNGSWETDYTPCPIEFALRKCDPNKLRSVNYFVYTNDGSQLNEKEAKYLVLPGKIMAVYEFGTQKYCKACNEDGIWSSYPQYQLCNLVNWIK